MVPFEDLIAKHPKKSFRKRETIFVKGEVPSSVYLIEKGYVKAYTINSSGAERQVAIHCKEEDIPIGFGLSLTRESPYYYEAYSDCVVRLVPREEFAMYIKSDLNEIFRRYVLLDNALIDALARLNALEQSKAGDKVAFMILQMAMQIGTKVRPYKSQMRLAVTQQEIANILGITRETAGNELRKLELKNILTHTRNSYILYIEKLRRYLDDK
jgi:CRP/FNR family transcriptional regulator, cyclic AMP receptor protein